MPSIADFAKAISVRITDEWEGTNDFPKDAESLQIILEKLFTIHPKECRKLIGTGIIEEDYFEDI